MHPTGYKHDSKPVSYPTHHGLVGAPVVREPTFTDLSIPWLWQSQYGMCLAETIVWMEYVWRAVHLGCQDQRTLSPLFVYAASRAAGYADLPFDQQPTILADEGCEPGLAIRAVKAVGVVPEIRYPGPTTFGFHPQNVYAPPPASVVTEAYDGRGIDMYEVLVEPGRRLEEIRRLMSRGIPCGFASYVDTRYMRNRGELVTDIDYSDPQGGWHAQAILDASDAAELLVQNWWDNRGGQGIFWGDDNGCGRWSTAMFERIEMRIFAMTSAPLRPKEGA